MATKGKKRRTAALKEVFYLKCLGVFSFHTMEVSGQHSSTIFSLMFHKRKYVIQVCNDMRVSE